MKVFIMAICLLSIPILSFAQFQFPPDCTTMSDKMEYCYIAQETLRLDYNKKGKDFREGKITEKEWKLYKDYDFQRKSDLIIGELLKQKENMKGSARWIVDLNSF